MKTPLLFLTFNRLETTKQVFAEILKAQPPRLYLASDGPRGTVTGEAEKVQAVRDYLQSNINWDCKIKTLFRKNNLGCKYAVSGAIDWFFENEERGIILEDDCLPDQTFFLFCEELLEKYKDDQRIGQISGTNMLTSFSMPNQASYHLSNYGSVWGWATWKRAWEKYDIEMSHLHSEVVQDYFSQIIDKSERNSRLSSFNETYVGNINTWDYQWIYTRLVERMLIIIPNTNLITNIGCGEGATHTTDMSPGANLPLRSMKFPLNHPELLLPSYSFEKKVHKKKQTKFVNKIIRKLKNIWVKK